MEEAILGLPKQFEWQPEIVNEEKLPQANLPAQAGKFIVCGMGGSHLAAGLLKLLDPKLDLLIHRDYGLPRVPDYFLNESLLIASSYSGNTEETIDAFKAAQEAGLKTAVITTGGTLLELAQNYGVPHIQLPKTGIQPRMALGYFIQAFTALLNLASIKPELDAAAWREDGKKLAEKLKGYTPIIYSSTLNLPLAYIWKIKFNETGKIPAFYNIFPELNHNEMEGFDVSAEAAELLKPYYSVMLYDPTDDIRIRERMDVTADLYQDQGVPVEVVGLEGGDRSTKIFNALLLADWAAYYTAKHYDAEPEQVPLIQEFKKLIME